MRRLRLASLLIPFAGAALLAQNGTPSATSSTTASSTAATASTAPAAPAAATPAAADDPSKISFMEYDPPSTLKVSVHPVTRAKFPFVDVHSHQWDLDEEAVKKIVAAMDEMNMAVMVNLSGRGFNRTTGPDG